MPNLPTTTQSNLKPPLILVDGSSYLYRAFHALPALTNSKGFPTGAIYGVVNMLKRLIADYHPQYIAVVFDAKGKTFRDDLYAEYKATRKTMPEELAQQIQSIHDIIRAMGLPLVMIDGVEADDVIGTLAQHAIAQDLPCVISTGDKDLAQLVNTHVTLINTMTNSVLDPQRVEEKFGVPPTGIIDYLTLVGDTSDNIPGVPQVGPKTAAKWLQQYKTLDNLLLHADKITGKVGENLRAAQAQIPLTKALVTIKLDVPLSIDVDDLIVQPANPQSLIEFYKELEFKNWLAELLDAAPAQHDDKYAHYDIITAEAELDKWLAQLRAAKVFAFDTETTSLDYMQAKIVGVSFAAEPGKAAYVPFGHDYENAPAQLAKELVLTKLKPILTDPSLKKIGHHTK
ncbi:MAG TPA: 5'-3' exonuclease H3TH domain-containing protein, partial [Gammaproteobacteria bacterium]|nr:5'-3' exonuclease H3TH domain-containing protein [Gammaproteobacteria bacterium]